MNPRDHQKDFGKKKEGHYDPNYTKITSTSTSRQWSNFKNPRIVRVSRTFGGKDRHSKVCTVRGLRDRRIRLSVPTAIQLYDLQDRLGLSQPSKVVDWLIDATKQDIDKLPPLPIVPGINYPVHDDHQSHQPNEGFEGLQNFFPISGSSCQSSVVLPTLPYFQWDPPSLSLSQFGPNGGGYNNYSNFSSDQQENLSLNSQLYLPSINIPPFSSTSMENIDQFRQINQLHNLQQNSILPTAFRLISPATKSFGSNVNSKSVHSHKNDGKDKRKYS